MKRNTKNIIMILIVLLSVGTIYLTMNYAKNNIKTVNNQSNNNMSPPSMENTNTPPEKPSEDTKNETNTTLTWPYYVVFGVLSLIISLIIIHLIMSKFNKKTFKETYENTDKIIIQILLAIILTSSLTYIDKIITDKYFIKKEAQNPNQNIENKTNITYSANKEINEDTTITEGTYTSLQEDENAILVTGDIDVNISNIKVTKTKDSDSGDNTSFYGMNSAILTKDTYITTLNNKDTTNSNINFNGYKLYVNNIAIN